MSTVLYTLLSLFLIITLVLGPFGFLAGFLITLFSVIIRIIKKQRFVGSLIWMIVFLILSALMWYIWIGIKVGYISFM